MPPSLNNVLERLSVQALRLVHKLVVFGNGRLPRYVIMNLRLFKIHILYTSSSILSIYFYPVFDGWLHRHNEDVVVYMRLFHSVAI